MAWIRSENGSWVNLDQCQLIAIQTPDAATFRIYAQMKGHNEILKSNLSTHAEAQHWLDCTIQGKPLTPEPQNEKISENCQESDQAS